MAPEPLFAVTFRDVAQARLREKNHVFLTSSTEQLNNGDMGESYAVKIGYDTFLNGDPFNFYHSDLITRRGSTCANIL